MKRYLQVDSDNTVCIENECLFSYTYRIVDKLESDSTKILLTMYVRVYVYVHVLKKYSVYTFLNSSIITFLVNGDGATLLYSIRHNIANCNHGLHSQKLQVLPLTRSTWHKRTHTRNTQQGKFCLTIDYICYTTAILHTVFRSTANRNHYFRI